MSFQNIVAIALVAIAGVYVFKRVFGSFIHTTTKEGCEKCAAPEANKKVRQ